MENLETKLQEHNRTIELLERQKNRVVYNLQQEKDKNSECCRRLKRKLNQLNKKIEELYSQISLLKIRNMMNLF